METQECVTTSKVCPGCKELKLISEFHFDKWKGKYFSRCKKCTNERMRSRYQVTKEKKLKKCAEYRENNQEKIKKYLSDWYQRNREHVLSRCNEYRKRTEVVEKEKSKSSERYYKNREKIQQQRKLYYQSNPEAVERLRKYRGLHYENNKPSYYARRMKRIAAEKQAIPKWADLAEIVEIYELAISKTVETGIVHEVDHIIPLQGKNVCGLHVAYNLRVVTRTENRMKSNKLVEDIVRYPSESLGVKDKEP